MPSNRVSSDNVALGPLTALRGNSGVRGRLARSREIWGRWSLAWSWLAGPQLIGSATAGDRIEMCRTELGARIADSVRINGHADGLVRCVQNVQFGLMLSAR
jgi:hypothetical protein